MLKKICILLCLLVVSSAQASSISITPQEPFILTVDRTFYLDLHVLHINRPNTMFFVNIDNTSSKEDLYISDISLLVHGPINSNWIKLSSLLNLIGFDENLSKFYSPQTHFFGYIPAGKSESLYGALIVGGLQNYSEREEIPLNTSFVIDANLRGFYGSPYSITRNFSESITFKALVR